MTNLSGSQDSALLALIERRTGIVLQQHQMERFHHVVAEGCRLLGTDIDGYIAVLAESASDHPAFRHLVDHITINETYFFRDDAQIAFLRDVWLPKLVQRRTAEGNRTIRVWSAASSSGEEIYTVAMLLRDLIGASPGWRFRLIGTDIDDDALAKALRGIYSGWSFRCTPDEERERHFAPVADGFAVVPELAAMTTFQHLNLAADQFPSVARDIWKFDLILCRNVFIYFSRQVVRQVLSKLAASLAPDGIMMVGASDVVDSEVAGLDIRHHGSAFYFVPAGGPAEVPAPRAERKRGPGPGRHPALPRPRPGLPRDQAAPTARTQAPQRPEPRSPGALALAGRGDLAGAEREITRLIGLDPHDALLHLAAGTILTERGDSKRAEEHLRRALYLDRKLVEGHFRLAHLLLASGRRDAARKSLENGLAMARHHPTDQAVPGHDGMNYGQLAETLKAELERLGAPAPSTRRAR